MTITSNHSKWSTVTAFSLHVQKLQWIIDVIGNVIEEVWSFTSQTHKPWNPSLKNGFKLSRIGPPTPGTDIEKTDCQSLRDDLSKYLDQPSSSENESQVKQLARFLVWRLQTEAVPRADPQSSENADVTSTPIYERFARPKMIFISQLGRGSQCLAVDKKSWLGIEVAVKELRAEYKANFEKEIQFAELQHPHVVRVIDHWIGQYPTIVMELMDSNFNSFMKEKFKDGCPPLSWAIEMMHQLAEAMKYLCDSNISHRDLKSLNLLVRGCPCADADCIIVKLADFGTSKMITEDNYTTITGTREWMAPKVERTVANTGYTMAADVYSFAITCSEILTGKPPYHDKGAHETIPSELKKGVKRGTLRPTLPYNCPVILSAYLQKCWASNPIHRPKHFSEICNFLLYCKEVVLRKEMPSPLPSINDNDARVLLTHLGLKWCLERDYTGKLIHVSSPVYRRIMLAICNGDWEELLQGHVTEAIRKEAESFIFRDETGHGQHDIQDDAVPAHDNMMDKSSLTHLPGLVTLSAVALLSSFNKEGELRLTATVGRLLVLSFLISSLGLATLLEYRPTFLLLRLKDFLLSSSLFIAIVLVMYTKVRTMVTGLRRRKVQEEFPGYEPVIHSNERVLQLYLEPFFF